MILILINIEGVADSEVLRKAGGDSDHYNIKTKFAFGEDEKKKEFIEHGILLSDGSKCFFKGKTERRNYFITLI